MENEHVTINFEDFYSIQGNYDVENEDDSIDLEYSWVQRNEQEIHCMEGGGNDIRKRW